MTALLEITDKRQTYAALLDKAWPFRKADVVVVLRNLDKWQNLARLEHGSNVLNAGFARYLLQVCENNTASEAHKIFWDHGPMPNGLILVTHQWHMYRAFLTFLKTFNKQTLIIPYAVPSIIKPGDMGEWDKIEQYQEKGDVAEYRKGVEYLEWLNTHVTE